MKKWNRLGFMAVVTAICLLITGAFYSYMPKGAWWCSTFALVCTEATELETQQTEKLGKNEIQFKWKIAEVWQTFFG